MKCTKQILGVSMKFSTLVVGAANESYVPSAPLNLWITVLSYHAFLHIDTYIHIGIHLLFSPLSMEGLVSEKRSAESSVVFG